MKKIFLSCCILFSAVVVFAQKTQSDVRFILSDMFNVDSVDIYMSKEPYNQATKIPILYDTITTPDISTWVVFVDLMPLANWSHPCEYLFISVMGDGISSIRKQTPPIYLNDNFIRITPQRGSPTLQLPQNKSAKQGRKRTPQEGGSEAAATEEGEKWAVII